MVKINYYNKYSYRDTLYFLDLFLGNNVISSSATRQVIDFFNYQNHQVTEFRKLKTVQFQLLAAIYDKFDSLEVLIKTRG